MLGRVGFGGLVLLLLQVPAAVSAQNTETGREKPVPFSTPPSEDDLGAVAADAAAAADVQRERVTGDETFQGGFTCLAPAGDGDAGPIICESRINPVMPRFYFSLAWYLDRDTGDRVVDSISVRRQGEAGPFQVIEGAGSRAMSMIENNGFEMIDVNFDGYLDLRLIAEATAGPNVLYRNWLWSEGSRRFVGAPALDEIVSPEFDPETQEILSRWRSSAAEGGVDVYAWEEGAPVLIHRETDKYGGPGSCTRSFFDRIGGEMQKTGDAACN